MSYWANDEVKSVNFEDKRLGILLNWEISPMKVFQWLVVDGRKL